MGIAQMFNRFGRLHGNFDKRQALGAKMSMEFFESFLLVLNLLHQIQYYIPKCKF